MASGGYPVKYQKGYEITGIDEAQKNANTKCENRKYYTSDGRVVESNIDLEIRKAYEGVSKISFKQKRYRYEVIINTKMLWWNWYFVGAFFYIINVILSKWNKY